LKLSLFAVVAVLFAVVAVVALSSFVVISASSSNDAGELISSWNVIDRRRVTDINSPASFDDDAEITTNEDNATTATTAKRTATTANNDSFNDSFVLSWDMSPSKLHDATKISKFDSELLEQSMQNFLLGEVTAAKTSNSSSSSALT
jgi:hypothetical protein